MSLGDDVEKKFWLNDDLVMCLHIPAQNAAVKDEEFGNIGLSS